MLAYAAVIPVELTTDRLLLRQWRDEDAEPLHEIYEQPEFLATMPSKTLDETREQLDRFRHAWAVDGYSQWAACDPRAASDRTYRHPLPPRLAARPTGRCPRSAGCCIATAGVAASRPREARPASTPGVSTCRTSRVLYSFTTPGNVAHAR